MVIEEKLESQEDIFYSISLNGILPGLKENNIGAKKIYLKWRIFSEINKYSSRFLTYPFNSSILNSLDSISFIFVPFVSELFLIFSK